MFGHEAVDHRLGDAVELGLVDEPLPCLGHGVGVVADDVDSVLESRGQDRTDRHRVVGGEQDAVHALGDVVVDERDLLVDVGDRGAVVDDLDVAELFRCFLHPLGGGIEIADADQLGDVDEGDRLPGQVGRIGRLTAVVLGRLPLRRGRLFVTAGEWVGGQFITSVPPVLLCLHRGCCREHGRQHQRRE